MIAKAPTGPTIHTWRSEVTRYALLSGMALDRLTQRCFVLATLATLATITLSSCKRHDDAPPQQPQQPQYGYGYPQQPPPQYAPYPPPGYSAPPAYPSPPPMTPAFGFFCQSDFDLQCAYGRCIGGRCGGCSDVSQCKRGALCAASPVGGTCWPDMRGGGNAPAPPSPAPPPVAPLPPPTPGPTPTQPPPFTPPPSSSDPFAAARQSCVDRINQYRARVRMGPLARDASTEACDDEESRLDSSSNRAHGSFGKCGERAQNACPNYPGASVEDVLTKCLQQMFDEGPGGGHYDNMTSAKYSRASCGFVSVGNGRIWTVQNFFK